MKRKVAFLIELADSWKEVDMGYVIKFRVPAGKSIYIPWYEVEFDWDKEEDILKAATRELKFRLQEEYPNMEYMIHYWTWLD